MMYNRSIKNYLVIVLLLFVRLFTSCGASKVDVPKGKIQLKANIASTKRGGQTCKLSPPAKRSFTATSVPKDVKDVKDVSASHSVGNFPCFPATDGSARAASAVSNSPHFSPDNNRDTPTPSVAASAPFPVVDPSVQSTSGQKNGSTIPSGAAPPPCSVVKPMVNPSPDDSLGNNERPALESDSQDAFNQEKIECCCICLDNLIDNDSANLVTCARCKKTYIKGACSLFMFNGEGKKKDQKARVQLKCPHCRATIPKKDVRAQPSKKRRR